MASAHPNPLCCCEYVDKEGQTNHILACFCNCVELDAAFDSIVCCRYKHTRDWRLVIRVLEDRMRLPWIGGAKQISLAALLPMILLPVLFIISSQSSICTAVAFPATPFIIFQLHKSYLQFASHSEFYCNWMYTSFFLIFVIYETIVVPFLEINTSENFAFLSFSSLAAILLYKVKTSKVRVPQVDVERCDPVHSKSFSDSTCNSCGTVAPPRSGHCRVCQRCVPRREVHCLWFGCCIGSHNLLWFLLCLASLALALIYSSSLILTTVCRPVPLWGPILIPEDCSEVYFEFRFALCFVSGLYSIVISVIVLWALLRHCWLITLGVSGNEWRNMTLSQKCHLGMSADRPYSRGPVLNWIDVCISSE